MSLLSQRITIFLSGIFAIVLFSAPLSLFALDYGGLGGRPAFPREDNPRTDSIFVHTAEPGTVIEEGIRIVNNKQERKTALVYATDSTPSTGGGFACEQMSDTKDDVGAWIQLEKNEVTLEPAKNELIPFTITIPQNASVGEHNGCIAIQEKKGDEEKGAGAHISTRLGLRVAITIPGELVRDITISDFTVTKREDGSFLLTPAIENSGNVSVDVDVSVQTRHLLGFLYHEHGGQFPVLRGEIFEQNFELKKPFWGGWYRTSLEVTYDKGDAAGVGMGSGEDLTVIKGPSQWFFSMPTIWGLIVEIIILIGILWLLLLMYVAKKKSGWIKRWSVYTVQEGDDIQSISKTFRVPWKLFVKVNKLKPPYILSPGEEVRVPRRKNKNEL
jgi:LysM repeat protein